jgi:predicted GIY-YIG superfamily endonuclease
MTNCLYRHFAGDVLLYIGVSLSAITRLRQHRECSEWYTEITRVEIEWFETRDEALKAETEAIRREKPKFNYLHNRPSSGLPKSEVVKVSRRKRELLAEQERIQALRKICLFDPLYSLEAAANLLGLNSGHLKRMMNDGKVSYVMLPSKKPGCRDKPYMTGWQIIDFIESLPPSPTPTS